ncbi:MAG: Cna B-type domain-containing protein, partial [Clostridiales bacterium]|nr:Cna B-type domain-containing protein [Clostridiales bacterium]
KNGEGKYLQADKKTFDTDEYFFTVASGASVLFENLPVGTYTVTEDTDSVSVDGYTFEVGNSTTNVEKPVVKDGNADAELVNKFTKDVGTLEVTKTAKDNNDKSVAGSFQFSVKNSAGLYLQADEKSFADTEVFFTIATSGTKTFNNLPVGEYTVTENTDAVNIEGYTFELNDSTLSDSTVVYKDSTAHAGLINKFTQDAGSLTVSKSAVDNYNKAVDGTFQFSVKNSDGKFLQADEKSFEDEEFFFTVAAGSTKKFENLPVGEYTVEEDTDSVSVTGYTFNKDDSTTSADATVVKNDNADAQLENKFTLDLGSLKISKALGDNAPDEASLKTYTFTITGPDNYSNTVELKAGESQTIEDLVPGTYTVTEDEDDAAIEGYDLEVTGGGVVSVVAKAVAETTITNTYTRQTGSLTVTKTATDNNDEAVSNTFYFSVKNSEGKYLQTDEKSFGTIEVFFSVESGSSKTFSELPVGDYTVTEDKTRVEVTGYDFLATSTTEKNVTVTKSSAPTTAALVNNYEKHLGTLTVQKIAKDNNNDDVTGTFEFSVKNGDDQYLQSDEKTFDDAEYFFTVAAGSSKIFENLPAGKYQVEEKTDDIAVSGYTFNKDDSRTSGTGSVSKISTEYSTVTLENKFTKDVGSLKITKALGANAPDGASSKTYTFMVTGPDNYSKTVTIEGAGSETLTDLIPGTYTVTENLTDVAIDGYDLEVTGGGKVSVVGNAIAKTTVTNTYTKQKGSLTITKALGANAPDGASSKTYTFTVTGPDNYSNTVEIKAGESKTIDKLVPGTYTVTEDEKGAAIDGYDLEVTGGGKVSVVGNAIAKTTVTNTYTKQKGSLRIVKTLTAGYPKEAEDTVFAFTVTGVGFSKTVFITGEGSETIDNLEPGRYTVTENKDAAKIDNFDLIVTGDEGDAVEVVSGKTTIASITNTYKSNSSSKGSLKITKTLGEGAPDAANTKEYKFTVTGSGYSNTVTIKGSGSVTIVNLEPGKYSVTEDEKGAAVKGYDLKVTGGGEVSVAGNAIAETTVTNTYTETKGSLTVKKSVTGTSTDKVFSFTVTGPNNFSETFELKDGETKVLKDLPLDEYTVVENEIGENGKAQIDGYTLSVTGNGTAKVDLKTKKDQTVEITNAYTAIPMTEATVTKIWDDANDQDGIRPTELKVALLKNGTKHSEVTLNEANGWTATVPNLPVKDGTTDNVYTWEEDANALPQGYTLKSQSTSGTVTTITNSHTPVQIVLKVVKSWDDAGAENNRPSVLTVKLLADGSEVQSFDLTEADGWTASATVPKYKNGSEISYSWTEGSMPDGYTLLSSQVSADGLTTTITNTYDLSREKTSATVKKVWDDNNNADQKRPASIEFTLSNGTVVTLSEANNWEQKVDNLPKFDSAGNKITYTWTEGSMPAEYTKTGEDVSADGLTTTFTNKYTKPAPVKGSLKVTKALGADAPSDASSKIYKFKVTGTKGYEASFEIQGAGSYELTDLEQDTYTITEKTDSAEIKGYTLSVSNNGVTVVINSATQQECVITNTYTKDVEPTETNPTETNPTDTNPTDTNPTGSQPTDKSPDEDEQGPSESTTTPAPDKEIESVTIDDKPVSPDDYKKKPDGTVEFSPETIEGLTRGVHRAVIKYTDGTIVTIDFEVLASTRDGRKIVKTGDVADNNMLPTAALFAVALAAVAIVIFRKRRSESDAE